jgi:hypothetical protein
VHFYRNVFSHVPRPKMREVAAMMKAIHAAEDVCGAREKAWQVVAKLDEQRLKRAAELVEGSIEETLTYNAFPEEHWRRIRTTDVLDKTSVEIFLHPFLCSAPRRSRFSVPATTSFEPARRGRVKTARPRVPKGLGVDASERAGRLAPAGSLM